MSLIKNKVKSVVLFFFFIVGFFFLKDKNIEYLSFVPICTLKTKGLGTDNVTVRMVFRGFVDGSVMR